MARYNLVYGQPELITYIKTERSNPSDNVLDALGIGKHLIEEDPPSYDHETQVAEPYYEENDTTIVKKWRVKDVPLENPDIPVN